MPPWRVLARDFCRTPIPPLDPGLTAVIETPRLILRPYETGDRDALAALLGDARTMAFWPRPYGPQAAETWIARCQAHTAAGALGRQAVQLRPEAGGDGTIIGDCGVFRATVDGEAVNDLGYILHHSLWRRGLGFEMAAAMARAAFERPGLDSLHAHMPADHHGSRRIAEKLGMRHLRRFANARNRGLPTDLYGMERPADI